MGVTSVLDTEFIEGPDWQSDDLRTLRAVLLKADIWLPHSIYWRSQRSSAEFLSKNGPDAAKSSSADEVVRPDSPSTSPAAWRGMR